MSVEPEKLKEVMRTWTSGVTVVTTGHGDKRAGTTVSAFNSVSLSPPLILVCIHKESAVSLLVEETGKFAVSILDADQSHLSAQFAGYTDLPEGADKFYEVTLTEGATGVPILADAVAWLDCTLHAAYDGSTHNILVGKVEATYRQQDQIAPLVYFNRGYHYLAPEDPA